jgi:hypothetical protein
MPRPFLYNLETLLKAIERDKATLINEYDKVTKRTLITFKCNCGEEASKGCIQVVSKAGAFCKKCTTKKFVEKTKNARNNTKPLVCTLQTLHDTLERDKAVLLEKYDSITTNTKIKFKCTCGEESEKNCLQLIKVSGAFCKKCTRENWSENIKKTNMEKYGTECSLQAPHIKEILIENNLKKYGVENVFASEEVRNKIKNTVLTRYGVEHISQSKEFREKIKNTCLEKYGVENVYQVKEHKENQKKTLLEKYGVTHISQTNEFKEKFKETCLKKYGVEHASQTDWFKEKFKKTSLEKYGVDNPNKSSIVREKIKATCLERYGVEHASQAQNTMNVQQKNAKKYKEYTMPSGTIRKVQGYEPFALDELVVMYSEEDIITDRKDIPRISYTMNDKTKYYFPDIYIKSQHKIIEVKSTWTYKCKTDNIQEKEKATVQAGYNYETWIYDKKGNKTTITPQNKIESGDSVENECTNVFYDQAAIQ